MLANPKPIHLDPHSSHRQTEYRSGGGRNGDERTIPPQVN